MNEANFVSLIEDFSKICLILNQKSLLSNNINQKSQQSFNNNNNNKEEETDEEEDIAKLEILNNDNNNNNDINIYINYLNFEIQHKNILVYKHHYYKNIELNIIYEYQLYFIYHEIYKIPTVYFTCHYLDGTPCNNLEIIIQNLPKLYQNLTTPIHLDKGNYVNCFITQDFHPIYHYPCYMIHSCHTYEFMKSLQLKENKYFLLAWLNYILPIFHLNISITDYKNAMTLLL